MMPPSVAEMVPIMGMVTGIITTALFFWGVVKVAQSQVGAAFAKRIQGHHADPDPGLLADVSELQEQLEAVRRELADVHERLDFTERLLAQGHVPDRLPKA
jgi:hypothetical protein